MGNYIMQAFLKRRSNTSFKLTAMVEALQKISLIFAYYLFLKFRETMAVP